MRVRGCLVFVLLFSALGSALSQDEPPASLVIVAGRTATIQNGFVSAVFDLHRPSVAFLGADFSGKGVYAQVLSEPITLEQENAKGDICSAALSPSSSASTFGYTVISDTSDLVSVRFDGIEDCPESPVAVEAWTLTLARGSRGLKFSVEGKSSINDNTTSLRSVRRVIHLKALSLYALFSRGVVQMMHADIANYFGSHDSLPRFYALGGGTSLDIFDNGALNDSVVTSAYNVLVSASNPPATQSSIQFVILGTLSQTDQWTSGWTSAQPVDPAKSLPAESTWSASYTLSPNDRNFPAGNLTTGPNLPDEDLEALLTGIYGSSPGNLCTYDNEVVPGKRVAQIATTIAFPGRGYAGTYNYFDPDNFIALSAVLYSGDPYLQGQVRDVVSRSGEFLRVADNSSNGQLPHHFAKDVPTFLALSGATQTGPNTFWVKTALRYAHVTGDVSWLQQYMPTLRNASDFCFNLIDPKMNLLDAPGSLMIDVFVRKRYTSDSNAMVVGFLRDVAEAERIVGNPQKAAKLEATAAKVRAAMNQNLWAGSDDHFITQLNRDNSTRDFVDYDSNLIAVAHRVPSSSDAMERILARIDAGRCASANGGGPQWVSEVYYDKTNCVGGNVGDSATAMGRIAWFDAHARKVVGSPAALERFDADLKLLQDDLIKNTWMHERYTCDGQMMGNRTNYYFEYPSVVAMLIREVRYGIDVGLHNVVISPFGPSKFTYDVGNVFVAYSSGDNVEVKVPGHGPRSFSVDGMGEAGTAYDISYGSFEREGEVAYVDADGRLTFVGVAGERVRAIKKKNKKNKKKNDKISE